MSWRIRSGIVAAAVLLALSTEVPIASATEWRPPVGDAAVLLGFGVAYPGGTHRGVDLGAAAGTEVGAPAAGRVSFAGPVPADGGGTCTAVTLEFADGRKMSLLPLSDAAVVSGEDVEAGQILGRLASAGDDSSAGAHLHVSLRSGELYLDPGDLVRGAASVSDSPAGAPCAPPVPAGSGGMDTAAPGTSVAAAVYVAPQAVGTNLSDEVARITTPTSVTAPHAVAPMVTRKPEVRAAGVPPASSLEPASWRRAGRVLPQIAPLPARMVSGVVLGCATAIAAIGAALSRGAQPVRAR